jgi:protein arginine kinase
MHSTGLDGLIRHPGAWTGADARETEVALSTRARLARNVASYNFIALMAPEERVDLQARAREAIEATGVAEPGFYVELDGAPPLDRKLLVERHLISREHEEGAGHRGVAVRDDERVSIMVNEEDHLRLQALLPGLAALEAWRRIDEADSALEARLEFAFHPKYGYLTACPTNVGTGLRISVMLHLPALAVTRQLDRVFQAVSRLNLAVRGFYGEGTEATGHFYQISNQSSLGKSEREIVANIEAVVPQVVAYEREARDVLMSKHRSRVQDRAWRALGMLRSARVLTSEEALALLSAVRMGAHLGVFTDVAPETVNSLLVLTQPAHVQKREGRDLSPEERDAVRAAHVRAALAAPSTS